MATILFVEDNPLILDMLSERLRGAGYTMLTAPDGETAIRLCADRLPDLIIMDISLPTASGPSIDGWETTRRLRRGPSTGEIPILALTAHTTHEDRERSLLAGCDDFEPKPVNFPRLVEKIETLLRRSRGLGE